MRVEAYFGDVLSGSEGEKQQLQTLLRAGNPDVHVLRLESRREFAKQVRIAL
jgi:hypothetical protein